MVDEKTAAISIAAFVERWRYTGSRVTWADVVGHEAAVRNLRVLAEMLRLPTADLDRLRLRPGRGVVIGGPPGTGKSMLAKAFASEVDADIVAPPPVDLTPARITELYEYLAAEMEAGGRRVVILIDEAESIIGWSHDPDSDTAHAVAAMCEALDGLRTPRVAPVTVALTTAGQTMLSAAVTRPGRLAPRLECSPPSRAERLILLERASAGLPIIGELDIGVIADRTGDWTGAGISALIEEAVARSLIPDDSGETTVGLRQDLVAEVVGERWVVIDEPVAQPPGIVEAVHEAAHVIWATLTWGSAAVAATEVRPGGGRTRLADRVVALTPTLGQLLKLAGMALAGGAGEQVVFGSDAVSAGSVDDREHVTDLLMRWHAIRDPIAVNSLEAGVASDRGSERMRSELHATIEAQAHLVMGQVVADLAPHARAIRRLADELLASPELALAGERLQETIEAANR